MTGVQTCALPISEDVAKDIAPQVKGEIVQVKSESDSKVCEPRIHYVVPPGHIYVQGDNRNNSNDSRVWGSVPIENIKGKALFIWLSYRNFALHPRVWQSSFEFRWDRIGNFVQ